MYKVDVYLRVGQAVMAEGMSMREAARTFGLHLDTLDMANGSRRMSMLVTSTIVPPP